MQKYRTSAKMAQALKNLGFEVTTGIGGNCVVGVLRNGEGPVVMLRTDMDALPVKEATGLSWVSEAVAAGLKEDRMPVISVDNEDTPPVENDQELVGKAVTSMTNILGKDNVLRVAPATVAEDFGKYGRTPEKVKIALFWLGGVNPPVYMESIEEGFMLPALHSSKFAPDFEPACVTGVSAMSMTIIDLLDRD